MSNRFHNKFHRHNHHTAPTDRDGLYPDSAYDPIASRESPFQGEFYSVDQITTTDSVLVGQTLSATNGRFTQNVRIDNFLTVFNDISAARNIVVDKDVWISGNLTVLGDTTQLDTLVYATSAVSVVNAGTGPAIFVKQTGNQPVAYFFDDDIPALVIEGSDHAPGYIGINTLTPNEQLTIVGNVSGDNLRVSFNKGSATGNYTFAVNEAKAVGLYSLATNTGEASGSFSSAHGDNTKAIGVAAYSEGAFTTALGNVSHAEGFGNFAFGDLSHVEGGFNYSLEIYSHAEGLQTVAAGAISHAEGHLTATGKKVNFETFTKNTNTFTFLPANSSFFDFVQPNTRLITFVNNVGYDFVVASRDTSNGNISAVSVSIPADVFSGTRYIITKSGTFSHAEGFSTEASGFTSHSEGNGTLASGFTAHAEGYQTEAKGFASHSEGNATLALGNESHTQGYQTSATNFASHAEGNVTTSSGSASHAEGTLTKALGNESHAEGYDTEATNFASHSEGVSTRSLNIGSHSEGELTVASGRASHAEGGETLASDNYAHAEGYKTLATGAASHAAGNFAHARTPRSWVWHGTPTSSYTLSTTKSDQFMVSALNGSVFYGQVGIGTDNPASRVHIDATDAIIIPVGNTSQRVNVKGAIRYNSQLSAYEGYGESAWNTLGGVIDIDRDTYISAEDFPGANNDQLKFVTAGAERMIIQPDGKVGIGTSTPNELLTVAGNISAQNLIYSKELDFGSLERPSLTGVKQALDDFLYVPPAFSFARVNGQSQLIREVGESVVTPIITWSSNKIEPQAITSFNLTQPNGAIQSGNFNFTSFNDSATFQITQLPGTSTQSTSAWNISLVDWKGTGATTNTSIIWRYRVYFGVTDQPTPNNTDILSQSTTSQLTTSRTGLGAKTISPTNQYFFFAYPTRFGQTNEIRVNGLNFTAFTQQTINGFNNAVGGTDNYYVYRSNNLLTATYTIEII